jgi:hypothetical protein
VLLKKQAESDQDFNLPIYNKILLNLRILNYLATWVLPVAVSPLISVISPECNPPCNNSSILRKNIKHFNHK